MKPPNKQRSILWVIAAMLNLGACAKDGPSLDFSRDSVTAPIVLELPESNSGGVHPESFVEMVPEPAQSNLFCAGWLLAAAGAVPERKFGRLFEAYDRLARAGASQLMREGLSPIETFDLSRLLERHAAQALREHNMEQGVETCLRRAERAENLGPESQPLAFQAH